MSGHYELGDREQIAEQKRKEREEIAASYGAERERAEVAHAVQLERDALDINDEDEDLDS